MSYVKRFVFLFGALAVAAATHAADEQWRDRNVHVYSGHDIQPKYPTTNYGVQGVYEFDNQLFVLGRYDIAKEKSGGIDNNALFQYGSMIGGGYSFDVREDSKLQLGYLYTDIFIKNVEMGGVRVGTYSDRHIYANGPALRVVHRLMPKLIADASVAYLKYNIDAAVTYTQLGLAYDLTPSVYGRLGYNMAQSTNTTGRQWSAAVGYRF